MPVATANAPITTVKAFAAADAPTKLTVSFLREIEVIPDVTVVRFSPFISKPKFLTVSPIATIEICLLNIANAVVAVKIIGGKSPNVFTTFDALSVSEEIASEKPTIVSVNIASPTFIANSVQALRTLFNLASRDFKYSSFSRYPDPAEFKAVFVAFKAVS